jgi:cell division transport system ATP-binding protein
MHEIEFENVSKQYSGKKNALDKASFYIPKGEMVFLTGHSGAGKSTLLKLIMMMEKPSSGKIWINERNIQTLSRTQIAHHRRSIGVVLQDPHLLHDRNIFENVALPLKIIGVSASQIGRRVRAALDAVSLLGKESLNPEHLSSGEKQRVGIARAIVNKPSLILADEPTGNLDPDLSNDIMNLFNRFHQVGVTVLVASHDINLINQINKPRLVLSEGKIITSPSSLSGEG